VKRRTQEPESGGIGREIMTAQQAAELLHCHSTTVQRMVHAGKLPGFRIGIDFRFRRADLQEWIAQQHVELASSAPGPEPKVAIKAPTRRKLARKPRSKA
jgi:excisionase family DNA binding protein